MRIPGPTPKHSLLSLKRRPSLTSLRAEHHNNPWPEWYAPPKKSRNGVLPAFSISKKGGTSNLGHWFTIPADPKGTVPTQCWRPLGRFPPSKRSSDDNFRVPSPFTVWTLCEIQSCIVYKVLSATITSNCCSYDHCGDTQR